MKNKGIAIQTILLLVVGILTIGVIAFFIYNYTSGGTLSREECRGIIVNWCTNCWTTMKSLGSACDAWTAATCRGPTATAEVQKCASDHFGTTIPAGNRCENQRTFCQNFIPV